MDLLELWWRDGDNMDYRTSHKPLMETKDIEEAEEEEEEERIQYMQRCLVGRDDGILSTLAASSLSNCEAAAVCCRTPSNLDTPIPSPPLFSSHPPASLGGP